MTTKTPGGVADPQGGRIERVNLADTAAQRQALGMLLTGRSKPADAAIDQFQGFCQDQNINLDRLWTIREAGQNTIAAAVMIAVNPGRTGMLFVSPAARAWRPQMTTQLVREALVTEDPGKITMIQALLEPAQEDEAQALEAAGMHHLATLAYLQRRADLLSPDNNLAQCGCQVVHWSDRNRDLFQQTILASYQDTLDCPGLLGLRSIEDIIDGHMATGRFDPQLWSIYLRNGEPIAVMLLNELPAQRVMELVYLGVTPSGRRQGLGRQLVRHATVTAAARRALSVVLAVDEANVPARHLYQSLNFHTTARKRAMIVNLAAAK